MFKGCDGWVCDTRSLPPGLPSEHTGLPLLAPRCPVAYSSLSSALTYVDVAVSMTSERRVSSICSRRGPA